MGLFGNDFPKTVENFRALSTGEKGISPISGKPLHYKGSAFHRWGKGGFVQGGDIGNNDGTGGESIYGEPFEDEKFISHSRPYLLSMANSKKDDNRSDFFITEGILTIYDDKHVVFGEVIEGKDVVDRLHHHPDHADKSHPTIIDCGELPADYEPKMKAEDYTEWDL